MNLNLEALHVVVGR